MEFYTLDSTPRNAAACANRLWRFHSRNLSAKEIAMTREEKLAEFVTWVDSDITGDEKDEAQVFLDRLFQAFGQ